MGMWCPILWNHKKYNMGTVLFFNQRASFYRAAFRQVLTRLVSQFSSNSFSLSQRKVWICSRLCCNTMVDINHCSRLIAQNFASLIHKFLFLLELLFLLQLRSLKRFTTRSLHWDQKDPEPSSMDSTRGPWLRSWDRLLHLASFAAINFVWYNLFS